MMTFASFVVTPPLRVSRTTHFQFLSLFRVPFPPIGKPTFSPPSMSHYKKVDPLWITAKNPRVSHEEERPGVAKELASSVKF